MRKRLHPEAEAATWWALARRTVGALGAVLILAIASLTLAVAPQAAAVAPGPVVVPTAPWAYGDAASVPTSVVPNAPMVGMAANPEGPGYWEVASDGGIFSFGGAQFYGSMGGTRLNQPVVGMAATPDGQGYWEVASDGGIFSFGDAGFYGSTGNLVLNQPIVGMASTPDGRGYWLVASDGGIFSFGDAQFYGSMGGTRLNQPVVGMAATPDGHGYWMVASDGGIFSFGDATFHGSDGGTGIMASPVVGMAATPDGKGYWIAVSNGAVINFGSAKDYGSVLLTTAPYYVPYPIAAIAATPSGAGYWLLPTTSIGKALGRMKLPFATPGSSAEVCGQALTLAQDGSVSPLTCGNSPAVNAVAWDVLSTIAPNILALGPAPTEQAVLAAICHPGGNSTNQLSFDAYAIASAYYGWSNPIPWLVAVGAAGC